DAQLGVGAQRIRGRDDCKEDDQERVDLEAPGGRRDEHVAHDDVVTDGHHHEEQDQLARKAEAARQPVDRAGDPAHADLPSARSMARWPTSSPTWPFHHVQISWLASAKRFTSSAEGSMISTPASSTAGQYSFG